MYRKFRQALKKLNQTYDFPKPSREDAFFQKLEEYEKIKSPFFLLIEKKNKIFQMAAVCSAVILMIGGYGVYQNYESSRDSIQVKNLSDGATNTTSSVSTDVSYAATEEVQFALTGSTVSEAPSVTTTISYTVWNESRTTVVGETVSNDTKVEIAALQGHAEVKTTEIHQTGQQQTAAKMKATSAVSRVSQSTAATSKHSVVMTKVTTVQVDMKNTTGTEPDEVQVGIGINYSVTPAYRYEKTDKIIKLEESDCDDALYPSETAESDCVVSGTVISLIYTRVGRTPWTQVDIVINEVYRGTLHPGDIISIYEQGGYIPLSEFLALHSDDASKFHWTEEEIQNTTVFYDGGHSTFSVLGETCLYFLNHSTGNLPKGAYQYTENADDSRFQRKGNCFVNVLDNNNTISDELIPYLRDEEA